MKREKERIIKNEYKELAWEEANQHYLQLTSTEKKQMRQVIDHMIDVSLEVQYRLEMDCYTTVK